MLDLSFNNKVFDGTPLISPDELQALLYRSDELFDEDTEVGCNDARNTRNADLVDDLLKILTRIKSQHVSVESQAMKSIEACIQQLSVPSTVMHHR